VREHPALSDVEALLPPPDSREAGLLIHVLSCGECQRRALDLLKVPRPAPYDRYLLCFDELGRHLDDVDDLLDELLDPESEA